MPAVKPEDRITESDKELHVGLELPRHSARQIYLWAQQQPWPEGTELEQPREYHITLLYTPQGHDEHKDAWWLEHMEHTEVTINGIKAFPAQEKGYAYVLTLDADDVKQKAEEMQGRAEWAGLPVTHFEGGYKPHITVGYGPSSRLTGIKAPNFQFDVGPSSVSPPRIKESRLASVPLGTGPMYHVAPRNLRDRIQAEGLRGYEQEQRFKHDYPKGNYLFTHPDDAVTYGANHFRQDEPWDIWEADTRGLPVGRDSEDETKWPGVDLGDAWQMQQKGYESFPEDHPFYQTIPMRYIAPMTIPADRLRLTREDEGEHDLSNEVPGGWNAIPFTSIPWPGHESSKAPEPPNYRHHEKVGEKCSSCKMFFKGECWGYGNKEVSPEAVCDEWYPEHKRSAYDPQHVEILDHLSLTNVAANLHYKFTEGGMDALQATEYAKRLLKLIGYPPDDITVQAALQAWQQAYPDDKILESGSDPGQLPAPPTTPTESWSYGTKSSADLYHVAPTTERDRIRQHGLQPANPMANWDWDYSEHAGYPEYDQPTGVYADDDLEQARYYRHWLENEMRETPHDIWTFPGQGIEDPEAVRSEFDGGLYVPHTVPSPQLVEGPEHRWQLAPEKFGHSSGELCYSLPDSFSRIGALPTQQPLYHWLDASQIHDWMDQSHTGPGHTFLTETGDDPSANWNDDIPHFDNPVRLTIDPERLDPNRLDQTYAGWLGNHLYQGAIPPEAVIDIKSFKQPAEWQEDFSTVPSQVNNPEDHWGDGTDPSKRVHDVEFSNDWTFKGARE